MLKKSFAVFFSLFIFLFTSCSAIHKTASVKIDFSEFVKAAVSKEFDNNSRTANARLVLHSGNFTVRVVISGGYVDSVEIPVSVPVSKEGEVVGVEVSEFTATFDIPVGAVINVDCSFVRNAEDKGSGSMPEEELYSGSIENYVVVEGQNNLPILMTNVLGGIVALDDRKSSEEIDLKLFQNYTETTTYEDGTFTLAEYKSMEFLSWCFAEDYKTVVVLRETENRDAYYVDIIKKDSIKNSFLNNEYDFGKKSLISFCNNNLFILNYKTIYVYNISDVESSLIGCFYYEYNPDCENNYAIRVKKLDESNYTLCIAGNVRISTDDDPDEKLNIFLKEFIINIKDLTYKDAQDPQSLTNATTFLYSLTDNMNQYTLPSLRIAEVSDIYISNNNDKYVTFGLQGEAYNQNLECWTRGGIICFSKDGSTETFGFDKNFYFTSDKLNYSSVILNDNNNFYFAARIVGIKKDELIIEDDGGYVYRENDKDNLLDNNKLKFFNLSKKLITGEVELPKIQLKHSIVASGFDFQ